jgi:hypothetical protein
VTPEIDKHLTAYGKMKKRSVVLNNFLGGLAWGFGTVVGATLVVAVLVSIATALNIPFASDLINQLQPVRTSDVIQQYDTPDTIQVSLANKVKDRHEESLRKDPNVVGVAVGRDGAIEVYIATESAQTRRQIPSKLENVPVRIIVIGEV